MRVYFICFFFFLPVIIFARDIIVIAEDADLSIPLEGAVVTLRNGQQFSCDRNGRANVTLPDNRTTVITITYPGYNSFRLSIPAATENENIDQFTVGLQLGNIMQSRELVIEASRPETNETRSGRSVAISDRELTRTAEIGIIEDVMSSVKLLPGVGYTGMFDAMPSIRGGDPGDLMASFDGFYLESPYHWMGNISIFDPKMISSARLSHGVFSARYGHTISGLLEITSKTPSSTETEFEAAIGTSAVSLNLSIPLGGKGGILFMGKLTHWDTFVLAAQGLSRITDNETLDLVNSISTAPFIRSAALSMNYSITHNINWRLNAFFGSDGVGAEINTDYNQLEEDDDITGTVETRADYGNYQGFLITGLTTSPTPKLALKFTTGIGFTYVITDAFMNNSVTTAYNEDFLSLLPPLIADDLRGRKFTAPQWNANILMENSTFNAQLRTDIDYELGKGFIAAFGVQELYSTWTLKQDASLAREFSVSSLLEQQPALIFFIPPEYRNISNLAIIQSRNLNNKTSNQGFTTSGYGLIEYTSPNQRFGTELGLRADHLYFIGDGFTARTDITLNPRLNIDFNILKDVSFIDSLSATAGTGLFSSTPSFLTSEIGFADTSTLKDLYIKFNRSWTSVIGFKLDFLHQYSLNIEGYYKRIFDRGYINTDITSSENISSIIKFDGIGNVWGFDLQLQRMESRYIDGWISYTFTWAQYKDPSGAGDINTGMGSVQDNESDWYYPSFHRFHNVNIVLNIKPQNWLNIGVRFGMASGRQGNKTSNIIEPYPVLLENEDGSFTLIQKYRRKPLEYKEITRSEWIFPLDIKFSFFPVNRKGRANMEIYFTGENMLSIISLINPTNTRTTFNEYTGKTEEQATSANFDMPIPMLSFGVKWRY